MKFTTKLSAGYFPSSSKSIFWSITKQVPYKIFLWILSQEAEDLLVIRYGQARSVLSLHSTKHLMYITEQGRQSLLQGVHPFPLPILRHWKASSKTRTQGTEQQWCSVEVAAVANGIERDATQRHYSLQTPCSTCPTYTHSLKHSTGLFGWLS